MELLQSWKESLCLLKPKTLKPLLLATFYSFIQTWKILFTKFWWLLIIWFSALLVVENYFVHDMIFAIFPFLMWNVIGKLIVWSFLWLFILLIMRSGETKNWSYFRLYSGKFLWAWFIAILFSIICLVINLFMPKSLLILISPFLLGQFMIYYFYPAITIFFALFLYDSTKFFKNSLRSVKYAFKMSCYNYPLLIISFVLIFGLIIICSLLFGFAMLGLLHIIMLYIVLRFLPNLADSPLTVITLNMKVLGTISDILLLVFFSFYLCFLANLYAKQIHDKPSQYGFN